MQLPRRVSNFQPASAPDPRLVAAASGAALGGMVVAEANKVYQDYRATQERIRAKSTLHELRSDARATLSTWERNYERAGRMIEDDTGEEVPAHSRVRVSFAGIEQELRTRADAKLRGLDPETRQDITFQLDDEIERARARAASLERRLYIEHETANTDDATQMYVLADDYVGAAENIDASFSAGVLSDDQRQSRLNALASQRQSAADTALTEIYAAAQSGDSEALNAAQARLETVLADAGDLLPISDKARDEVLRMGRHNAIAGMALSGFESAADKAQFVADFARTRPQDVTPEEHQKLVAQLSTMLQRSQRVEADASAQADAQAELNRQIFESDLTLAVARGEAGEPEIEAALASEQISPAKRTQLTLETYRVSLTARTEAADIERVAAALESGYALDANLSEDRDAADLFYRRLLDNGLDPMTPEGAAQAAYLIRQTGVVPDTLKSQLRVSMRSGAPSVAAEAANAVLQIRDNAPLLLEQLDADTKALSVSVAEMVAAGTDAKTAVETARGNLNYTDAERQILRTRFREFADDQEDALEGYVNDAFDPSIFTRQPEAPLALAAEFNTLTEQYFLRTRNIDQARDLAFGDLQRVWGVSTISGRRELMKYPPELAGGTREGFQADTAGLGADIVAVSDHITARTAGGSYALMHAPEGALPTPVINDEGLVARWTPEPEPPEDYSDRVETSRRRRALLKLFDGPGDITPEQIAEMEAELGGR